jgi:hypothetical protein
MPATEFYDPILVDGQNVVWPAGPFSISDDRRQDALAVQFQYVIMQRSAMAWGANSGCKDDPDWFGKTEQKGAFVYDQPAQAYGLAVLVSKGVYVGSTGEQYIPFFETIYWSKTVRFERVETVTRDSYKAQLSQRSA